ncbi:30S ribosomal protein S6 [bacterium]|nr:30S ribosomal protein S6 [bacterium]
MEKIDHYEITFIVNGDIAETEHSKIVENVRENISQNNGKLDQTQELGRKKLQYPIQKSLRGNFYSIEFDIETSAIKEMEKEIKLKKEIIRYLIIKKPHNTKPLETEKSENNNTRENKIKNKVKVPHKSPQQLPKKEDLSIQKTKKETSEKEINTDLDKKLDEILNDDLIN